MTRSYTNDHQRSSEGEAYTISIDINARGNWGYFTVERLLSVFPQFVISSDICKKRDK